MQSWQPFPDTIPALQRVKKAGVKLVIISNTDRHIMEHTLRQLAPLAFDDVVVAEDLTAYKPDTTAFTRALEQAGAHPSEILHVAFGFKYDIGPAQEVGMQTAWVNRHREEPPGRRAPRLRVARPVGPGRAGRGPGQRRHARARSRARGNGPAPDHRPRRVLRHRQRRADRLRRSPPRPSAPR